MKNITDAEMAVILDAYKFIESPCKFCDARTGTHCNIFDVDLVVDEQVYIPCAECEDIAHAQLF